MWESKLHTQSQHSDRAAHLCLDLWMERWTNRELGVVCFAWIKVLNLWAQIIGCECNLNQVSWPEKEIRSKAGLNLCKRGMLRHALICFKVITYIHDRKWQWNSSSWCLTPPRILCQIFLITLSWVIQVNYWVYLTVLTWFWLMTSSQIQTC